jgi:hypothetical protein
MGDSFKTFRLIFTNYVQDIRDIEQQKTILLSLIDPQIFTIAHSIVHSGYNMAEILTEMQNTFNPVDELTTQLATFQQLRQRPGENISQFAIRITELGQLIYADLPNSTLQSYLVMQFISGLLDENLKTTIRLFGPETLQKAVLLVRRTQPAQNDSVSVATTNVPPANMTTCQLCQSTAHKAPACPKFKIGQKKANPNGFTSTFTAQQPLSQPQPVQQSFQPNLYRPNQYQSNYDNRMQFRQQQRPSGPMNFRPSYNGNGQMNGAPQWQRPNQPREYQSRWNNYQKN